MVSVAKNPDLATAIDQANAALDALFVAGVEPADAADARVVVGEVEVLGRRIAAVQVAVVAAVDRSGFHREDGHASAKVFVRHVANLSNAEAAQRARAARALRDMPALEEAFRKGLVGRCQVGTLARAHANRRVRDELCRREAEWAVVASTTVFVEFEGTVADWVRRVDEDGTCDRGQRNHENRDARLVQEFDDSWTFTARCGSLAGARLLDVFEAYGNAEFLGDWEVARATHGDDATKDHLPRTAAQRRFDAFAQIFEDAADHHAAKPGGAKIVTSLVMDQDTFERQLRRIGGVWPGPVDARIDTRRADPHARWRPFDRPGSASGGDSCDRRADRARIDGLDDFDLDLAGAAPVWPDQVSNVGYRCSTLDGRRIDPTEAATAALIGQVRRVVLDAASVPIDMGRTTRLFTGPGALAIRLLSTTCYWPGCQVPASQCQLDHLNQWNTARGRGGGGGRTDAHNGGPACGRHNRFQERGFTVHRDAAGRWQVFRPDGTELT